MSDDGWGNPIEDSNSSRADGKNQTSNVHLQYDPTWPSIYIDMGAEDFLRLSVNQLNDPKLLSFSTMDDLIAWLTFSVGCKIKDDKEKPITNIIGIFQDMVTLLWRAKDVETNCPDVPTSAQELIGYGILDPMLPPPHLTKTGLAYRGILLQLNKQHMLRIRHIPVRNPDFKMELHTSFGVYRMFLKFQDSNVVKSMESYNIRKGKILMTTRRDAIQSIELLEKAFKEDDGKIFAPDLTIMAYYKAPGNQFGIKIVSKENVEWYFAIAGSATAKGIEMFWVINCWTTNISETLAKTMINLLDKKYFVSLQSFVSNALK